MDHMIYIYAGLAFVLAGGGWFIGWHGGYRSGYQARKQEGERMVAKMMLNARYGRYDNKGAVLLDVNSLYPSEMTQKEANLTALKEAINDHLEVMDRDE